jgi:hypothetical protein
MVAVTEERIKWHLIAKQTVAHGVTGSNDASAMVPEHNDYALCRSYVAAYAFRCIKPIDDQAP